MRFTMTLTSFHDAVWNVSAVLEQEVCSEVMEYVVTEHESKMVAEAKGSLQPIIDQITAMQPSLQTPTW